MTQNVFAFGGGKGCGRGSRASEIVVGVAFEKGGKLRAVLGVRAGGGKKELRGATQEFLIGE